jgi:hypothetical protein
MASHRTKSISTKVTPDDYARLEALAGEQTISEWARAVLLRAANPVDAILLSELLALRTILLNLHFDICRGAQPTADTMQRLIERADQDKEQHAHERLRAAATRRD